jgi:hypothetical protein
MSKCFFNVSKHGILYSEFNLYNKFLNASKGIKNKKLVNSSKFDWTGVEFTIPQKI